MNPRGRTATGVDETNPIEKGRSTPQTGEWRADAVALGAKRTGRAQCTRRGAGSFCRRERFCLSNRSEAEQKASDGGRQVSVMEKCFGTFFSNCLLVDELGSQREPCRYACGADRWLCIEAGQRFSALTLMRFEEEQAV